MRFAEFVNESVITNKGVFLLKEGIQHIEDLPPEEFIHAVRNMAKMIATEKLDGANLVCGFNMEGKFYTSREAKGGSDRFYSVEDYSERAADNGFKAAHAALKKVTPQLKKIMDNGQTVECEVLFGRQPNAIVYGSNYIAFLRMLPGDNQVVPNQDEVKALNKELKNKQVEVTVPITTTKDGMSIETKRTKLVWKFTSVSYVEQHHFTKVNVEHQLEKFEQWLTHNPPKNFKTKKEFIQATKDFMLPIKEQLLDNIVRTLKPTLRDVDVTTSEDIGVEGVVFLDPQTGQQVKLVDKSVFTLINQFNHAIRNQIKGRGVSTKNWEGLFKIFNATIQPQTASLYDDMLQQIAQVIGIPGLGKYMQITRTIKKFENAEAFVGAWNQDFNQVKTGAGQAISKGIADLDQARTRFESEWKNYKLQLNSGREIGYTDEIFRRTLMVFAETRQELLQIQKDIEGADTLANIANALFGRQLKAIQ